MTTLTIMPIYIKVLMHTYIHTYNYFIYILVFLTICKLPASKQIDPQIQFKLAGNFALIKTQHFIK